MLSFEGHVGSAMGVGAARKAFGSVARLIDEVATSAKKAGGSVGVGKGRGNWR